MSPPSMDRNLRYVNNRTKWKPRTTNSDARGRNWTPRARYFDLYDLAPVGYCTLSTDGLIIESDAAAKPLGIDRDTLIRQPISRFLGEAEADSFHLLCNTLTGTGEAQASELQILCV